MKEKTTPLPTIQIRKNTIEVEEVGGSNNDPGEELNNFNTTIDLTENPLKCAYCSKNCL